MPQHTQQGTGRASCRAMLPDSQHSLIDNAMAGPAGVATDRLHGQPLYSGEIIQELLAWQRQDW